jgi:hypothetical protein
MKKVKASARPNYKVECENCSQVPTVEIVVVFPVGTISPAENTGLCGPCCFGTASAIDPETW